MNRATSLILLMALIVGCASPGGRVEPRDLHDMPVQVIESEVIWSGEVVVDKIVIVRRGGHLKVASGTNVRFKKIDWDGDGIGDAEITVEGRFTALGTFDEPITFVSAAPSPAPADWKYLHVNFAEGAELSHVRVSHAYSGLQVHYSPATVSNSVFTDNVDGVRFSTAKLSLTGSLITGNRNGIRFEERGHPAVVTGNEIRGNEVGIFAVSHCFGKSEISANNLYDNSTGVKMGLEQFEDLPLPTNYWGPDPEAVKETFMDGRIDSALGQALIDPALEEKAPFTVPLGPVN